jgi:hypothetical protein
MLFQSVVLPILKRDLESLVIQIYAGNPVDEMDVETATDFPSESESIESEAEIGAIRRNTRRIVNCSDIEEEHTWIDIFDDPPWHLPMKRKKAMIWNQLNQRMWIVLHSLFSMTQDSFKIN